VRILHTSDWHLGRSFHRVGMLDAQAAHVDHLVEVVRSESVDVVLVAGDVYDRALPGVDVVGLLDDALSRLTASGATVVLSSGNHDSARRLGFGSRLFEAARVHVRTQPARCAEPVLLDDAYGAVALYPFPYLEPALAAPALGCPTGAAAEPASHQSVLAAAMQAVRADLAARRAGTRSVVAAHAFVVGGQVSESERDISVGGVASVGQATFAGVDYVALGHLHGRQRLAETVRYSGSPLAYSFSEVGHTKGSWLVTLGRSGVESVQPVDAPVPRPLGVLRGELADLLREPGLSGHEQSWCQVTLTDAERPAEAMHRLRSRFPHTVELRFQPEGVSAPAGRSYTERVAGVDDVDICCGFVEHVRGRRPDPGEVVWLREAVAAGRLTEAEEDGLAARRARRREAPTPSAAGFAPGSVSGPSDGTGTDPTQDVERPTLIDLPAAEVPARRRVATQRGPRDAERPSQDEQLALEDVG
jgi:DNA repair protein SbcD/Mre11